MKEIIIFMTACKLVIGNYKGLYNANVWMSAALWGISGNGNNNYIIALYYWSYYAERSDK